VVSDGDQGDSSGLRETHSVNALHCPTTQAQQSVAMHRHECAQPSQLLMGLTAEPNLVRPT